MAREIDETDPDWKELMAKYCRKFHWRGIILLNAPEKLVSSYLRRWGHASQNEFWKAIDGEKVPIRMTLSKHGKSIIVMDFSKPGTHYVHTWTWLRGRSWQEEAWKEIDLAFDEKNAPPVRGLRKINWASNGGNWYTGTAFFTQEEEDALQALRAEARRVKAELAEFNRLREERWRQAEAEKKAAAEKAKAEAERRRREEEERAAKAKAAAEAYEASVAKAAGMSLDEFRALSPKAQRLTAHRARLAGKL